MKIDELDTLMDEFENLMRALPTKEPEWVTKKVGFCQVGQMSELRFDVDRCAVNLRQHHNILLSEFDDLVEARDYYAK